MKGELRVVVLSLDAWRRCVFVLEGVGSGVFLALRISFLDGILTGARLKENFLFILTMNQGRMGVGRFEI